VGIRKNKLQELDENSRLVLNNRVSGSKYAIPLQAISKLIHLEDPSVDEWTMYLASSAQPHVFTIRPRGVKLDATHRWTREFLDASKFYFESAGSEDDLSISSNEPNTLPDTSEPGQFEVEDELEGFIYTNWSSLPVFKSLEKFERPESHPGRQVPTDEIGEMDFLARDRHTGQFVVFELKRNRSSDDALGQLLRYMGWVAHRLADGDHNKVRGVIICQKQDERLKFAVTPLGAQVSVLEYQVRFQLNPAAGLEPG
jgi:hypothetical protein